MIIDLRLHRITAAQPYPLLFATISGAHLYGFPSPDSDYDLRGAHVLPVQSVVGLEINDETLEDSRIIEGLEMDIVSHDVRKFFRLLLKKNGYVLEQLFSPLIVQTTAEHEELKSLPPAVQKTLASLPNTMRTTISDSPKHSGNCSSKNPRAASNRSSTSTASFLPAFGLCAQARSRQIS